MRISVLHHTGLLLLSLVTHAVSAQTTLISNYSQLVTALERGDDVKAILHFDKCHLDPNSAAAHILPKLKGASTRFNFNEYTHYKLQIDDQEKDIIVTSITMLIEHPHGEFWNNYARLRIFEDNSAELHIAYYDPLTDEKQLGMDWSCHLSNGKDGNGIMIFDASN
ncbi:Uncharacterised protein [Legionella donaldsonii]|uniref:VirK protein n=1 Tax=Legionella donaldsonii TaxID=45060 RepID=A0A378J9Y2_9GAMM|nr:hypothetical protein [Legionella donaldsonii]STX43781.1 Uncharacterised protein [Legionella donaldsonii]